MPFDFALDVHFLNPEILADRLWVGRVAVKQSALQVEGISKAMGWVDTHHQRLVA